jgi:putative toxin-antitoxin system antitoxin component (TIGR02293 family)
MVVSDVARQLGGARAVRRSLRSPLDLARAVEGGLPVETADALVEGGALDAAELYRLVVPRRTLSHRRSRGGRLTPPESDRVARVARAVALAQGTLGTPAKAHAWLRRPNRELGGAEPLDLLVTDQGARTVEAVLDRLAYGVYA